MCKKLLTVLLSGAALLVSSCVDKDYDLANKEIATDVKVEGNTVALPVGSLKAIVLDSLINIDEIEILDKNGEGVYSISMDSTISVEEGLDPITLDIAPVTNRISVEFDEVNISKVHIDAANIEPAKFTTPTISLEKLNSALPKLESNVSMNLITEEELALLKSYPESVRENQPITKTVNTGKQVVACNFSYTLPEEVETIRSIKLGSADDRNGSLVNVVITNPRALQNAGIDKRVDFTIDFPEMFRLSINPNADQVGKYVLENEHSIRVANMIPDGATTVISFYMEELVGVEKHISNGSIDVLENIEYNIEYYVNGKADLSDKMISDINNFAYDVDLEVQLSFIDVAGKTKDIKVDFNPIEMDFGGEFDNLQYIDMINYVEFDETVSRIKFETHMPNDWLSAYELKDGYALKIAFPHQLTICPIHSEYEGKDKEIVYNEEEHAFYVYDLRILSETHWDIALQKLTLNLPVVDGHCHMDVKADIRFVSPEKSDDDAYFMLAGAEMESMVDVLDKLKGEKEAVFTMSESDLIIKDAVVHTEVVHSSLDTETTFELNEKVPNEIGRIEKIGFSKDVEMTLDLQVLGLENLDTDLDFEVNMALPSFLKLQLLDEVQGVTLENGILDIKRAFNPSASESLRIKFLCSGFDFMTEEFGYKGLVPEKSEDGNSYLSYSGDVVINGDASIHGTEFHSTVLENDIAFNVEFDIDEIAVKTFHGTYSGEIEAFEEKVQLDLGEELEFLREEGNSITLANPQLEFVLKNTTGVPVDLELQICGSDENGEIIEESKVVSLLSIMPAEYNEATDELTPVETKIFLTADDTKKAGYENIEVPNLANLLKKIPHFVSIKVNPVIKTGVTHHVDISQPIKLDGAYSVVVPLEFEDMHVCYNDTISDLQSSIGETLDMFSNVSLSVKMDVINTVPLGLSLSAVPLDVDGNVIDNVEIDKLSIQAGSGEDIIKEDGTVNEESASQKLVFAIKSKGGDISLLDKLALTVEAVSNHTAGSAALAGGQGIKMSNIVVEISGDVEMDLKDLGK